MSSENPIELLDDPSEKLEMVLEDPLSYNFRGREKDWIDLYPDHPMFREARADLGNQNVHVKTNMQSSEEGYTAVISKPEISLVEGHAEVHIQGKAGLSTLSYAVVDDRVFLYDGSGWEETYNPGVQDVAAITPELYEQALNYSGEETEQEESHGPDPVPPPEDDGMFTD